MKPCGQTEPEAVIVMIIRITDSPLLSDLVGESLPDVFGLTTVETSILFQLQVFDFSGSPAHRDVSSPATRQSLTHSRLCSLLHVSRNLCLLMKQVPSASQEGLYISYQFFLLHCPPTRTRQACGVTRVVPPPPEHLKHNFVIGCNVKMNTPIYKLATVVSLI